jgi:hypothetical protein
VDLICSRSVISGTKETWLFSAFSMFKFRKSKRLKKFLENEKAGPVPMVHPSAETTVGLKS